jgi:hypothetical protein
MDINRIYKSADRIIDVFSDMRIRDNEIMYVAMQVVMRAYPVEVLHRVVEFGEQVKWEINNDRSNSKYVQDELFN